MVDYVSPSAADYYDSAASDPWRQYGGQPYVNIRPPTGTYSDTKQTSVIAVGPDGGPIHVRSLFRTDDIRGTLAWQQMLQANGLLASTGYSRGNWDDPTREALMKAMYQANKAKMPLQAWLQRGALLNPDYVNGTGSYAGATYNGPVTTTQTSSSINLTSRGTARLILAQALAQELGREPSPNEVSDFLKGLNQREENNPSVTTTTTTTKPDGKHDTSVTSTSRTKEPNTNPTAMAERFAEGVDPKESERYQTGNYYNVIAQMLGV